MDDRRPDVDLGSQMADQLGPEVGSEGLQQVALGHAHLVQSRPLVHPPWPPRREIIDDCHVIVPANQGVDQVRPDEAGAAGDEYAHGCAVYAQEPGRT
jgi:hypothetical protein